MKILFNLNSDDVPSVSGSQLKAFKAGSEKTGAVVGANYWNLYNSDGQPDMQVWQGGQLGASAATAGQEQQPMSAYPQSYGTMTGNPNSPYAGYLEKQIASYPVMIYSLSECVPCQRAKQLIATHYPDARAHYLGIPFIGRYSPNDGSF